MSAWVSRPWPQPARSAIEVGGALVVLAAVAWPLLFTNATFNNDWLNHFWYLWHQSLAIRAHHLPSLFLNYDRGIFYPVYAFYGGTVYALAGTLSLVLGNSPLETYVLTYLLGFTAAYGGWYWLGRGFGVRGWPAHVPGLVFVTSASYLSMIYDLGDWPEFLAVSMMPLMIAAGLSVLRGSQLRFGPALALIASSVVFFGSHLLTVIWGSTILIIVAVAILVCVPEARRSVTRSGVLRMAALMIPALLLSAWFLLPAAAYESHTVIARSYPTFRALLRETMFTVAARHLFTLSRARASGSIVTLSLPILAVGWVLASIVMLAFTRRTGAWMRALLVVVGATVLLVVTMTHAGLILALPRVYATLQFGFRLESFVLLGISGAMLAVLVMASGGGRRLRYWTWLLAPIAVMSVIGAIEQTDIHPNGKNRSLALASYYTPIRERQAQLDYVDGRLPINRQQLPRVDFPIASVPSGGRLSKAVQVPPDRLVATNIRAGSDLVNVRGARIVGTDLRADDVLEVTSGAGGSAGAHASPATATISVAPANHFPVVAGRVISLIALVVMIVELALIAARGMRLSRARRSS
jgi:hypothetical protein